MSQNRDEEQERLRKKDEPPKPEAEEKDIQVEFCNEMCHEIQVAKRCNMCWRVWISFFIFLIVGILMMIKQLGAGECNWLSKGTLLFWICCFVAVFLRVPVDALLVCLPWKMKNIKCVFGYHGCLDCWEWILYLVYMVVATILVLVQEEECEELFPFIRLFLIISYIVLIFWACKEYSRKKEWEEENL